NVTDAPAHTEAPHCGSMGHVLSFPESCALAHKFGFDAVNADRDFLRQHGPESSRRLLETHRLEPAAFAFSAAFNAYFSDTEFEQSLVPFEKDLSLAGQAGFRRCVGFVQPSSHQFTFYEHFTLLRRRLQRIVPLLKKHGIRLGLEFIGPTTMRLRPKFDFVHTIDGVRSLIAAADAQSQVGFKLDSLHWYASGAGLLDIEKLAAQEIVYVEINDGLKGNYDRFTLPEFQRELPGATGAIDLDGMLAALDAIGFSGPVVVEPWNETLRRLPTSDAVRLVKAALDHSLNSAGIETADNISCGRNN
ncbi:MAG: TIM barrel protein, partial [Desulfobacterales bacterium]